MTKNRLTGGCLCGEVAYVLDDEFSAFYQCHCTQCQQLTGSAFAANIFTHVDNIEWLSGYGSVKTYEHPTRQFSKAFCQECGSAMPFVNKSQTSLIVPAGSLADQPSIEPQANIFVSEKACWLKTGAAAEEFSGFPNE